MDKFWNDIAISRIISCESNQVKDIVDYLGFSRSTFLRFADFKGVDLRNQDLSEINTDMASFEGAIADETTRLSDGRIPVTNKDFTRNYIVNIIYDFDVNDVSENILHWKIREYIDSRRTPIAVEYNGNLDIFYQFDEDLPRYGESHLSRVFTRGSSLIIKIGYYDEHFIKRIWEELIGVFPTACKEILQNNGYDDNIRVMPNDLERAASVLIENLTKMGHIAGVIVFLMTNRGRGEWDSLVVTPKYLNVVVVYQVFGSRENLKSNEMTSLVTWIEFNEVYNSLELIEYKAQSHLRFTERFKRRMAEKHKTWSRALPEIVEIATEKMEFENAIPIILDLNHISDEF